MKYFFVLTLAATLAVMVSSRPTDKEGIAVPTVAASAGEGSENAVGGLVKAKRRVRKRIERLEDRVDDLIERVENAEKMIGMKEEIKEEKQEVTTVDYGKVLEDEETRMEFIGQELTEEQKDREEIVKIDGQTVPEQEGGMEAESVTVQGVEVEGEVVGEQGGATEGEMGEGEEEESSGDGEEMSV